VIDAGTAFYETVGALGNGERVWLMVRLAKTLRLLLVTGLRDSCS